MVVGTSKGVGGGDGEVIAQPQLSVKKKLLCFFFKFDSKVTIFNEGTKTLRYKLSLNPCRISTREL